MDTKLRQFYKEEKFWLGLVYLDKELWDRINILTISSKLKSDTFTSIYIAERLIELG